MHNLIFDQILCGKVIKKTKSIKVRPKIFFNFMFHDSIFIMIQLWIFFCWVHDKCILENWILIHKAICFLFLFLIKILNYFIVLKIDWTNFFYYIRYIRLLNNNISANSRYFISVLYVSACGCFGCSNFMMLLFIELKRGIFVFIYLLRKQKQSLPYKML